MLDQERDAINRWLQSRQAKPTSPTSFAFDPVGHIDYHELPLDTTGRPGSIEWNFYRREVGRLIDEEYEGKWILIKGEAIVGFFESESEAREVAARDYFPESILVHRIQSREPLMRTPPCFLRPRISVFQSRRAG